jgi:hypothetical protein
MRVNDGAVVRRRDARAGGDVGVRWEPSGIVQMVVPLLLKPA